jgi:hypothetical protein
MRKRILFTSALLAGLAIAPAADAQGSATDAATGAALFTEARALMAQAKYADACKKFEASHKLVESAGALLSLGDCYEKNGQTASAYGAFKEAGILARRLKDTDRENEAKRRSDLVEPKLSKLVLDVVPENHGRVTVQQNGRPLLEVVWGFAVPVDPGEHTIDAQAQGKKTWTQVVRIEAKPGTTTVAIPALEDAPAVGTTSADSRPFWGAQRIAAAAVGGAGLVGIVVGAVFGARAMSKMSASKPLCRTAEPADVCNAPGLALRKDAGSAATGSTAGFIVGGAALAGGVILFFTAPSARAQTGAAGPRLAVAPSAGGATLTMEGTW